MRRSQPSQKKQQRGAVAVLVGVIGTFLILTGMLALVVDLGLLFIRKTELQNAADAAALAGAQELNNTAEGVDNAVLFAIETASENQLLMGSTASGVEISETQIRIGPSPTGPWSTTATARNQPIGMLFVEIDTRTGDFPQNTLLTRFRGIGGTEVGDGAGATTVSTFGYAVAGPYAVPITPMAVCAIDETLPAEKADSKGVLLEWGFRRGTSYNLPTLNPLAGKSQLPLWVNPVDRPVDNGTTGCTAAHTSASFVEPFVCGGTMSADLVADQPARVFVDTGWDASLEKALNSRFGPPQGGACKGANAPADGNTTEYLATTASTNSPHIAGDTAWMSPRQDAQTIKVDVTSPSGPQAPDEISVNPTSDSKQGVISAYNRAVYATGGTPPRAGNPVLNADWPNVYWTNPADANTTPSVHTEDYPDGSQSPYRRGGGTERRVLNTLIVDCKAGIVGGAGACSQLSVLGVGRFFMQVKADFNGSPKLLAGEFAGIIPSSQLRRTIRLFR